jgi:hypothetical protein
MCRVLRRMLEMSSLPGKQATPNEAYLTRMGNLPNAVESHL